MAQVLWTRKFDMTNCFDVELEKDHLGKPSQIILRIYSKISGKVCRNPTTRLELQDIDYHSDRKD